MVFIDPPYNIKIEGNVSGKGAVKHGDFKMASGEMDEVEFLNFLTTALELLAKFSLPGSIHYVAMDWHHMECSARGWAKSLRAAAQPMCMGERARWAGLLFLPVGPRALLRFQEWQRSTEKQYPTRKIRPQPNQHLELPERCGIFKEWG